MRICSICGKTDKETKIIHSEKYGMDLCKYHHELLSRKHLSANNIIKENKLLINDKEILFDIKYLPIIQQHKWSIKYITNPVFGKNKVPYVIDSEGHYLVNIICRCSGLGHLVKSYGINRIIFKDNNTLNCKEDNLMYYQPKEVRRINFNTFGYLGIYQSHSNPDKYRFNITINHKLISTKEFPRPELVVYLAYLVGIVLFNDKSFNDKTTKEYLSKLTIVDKENIEKYFINKFLSLDKSFTHLWAEYKRDKKFQNKLNIDKQHRFSNEL